MDFHWTGGLQYIGGKGVPGREKNTDADVK
jgi:hypothetical protein